MDRKKDKRYREKNKDILISRRSSPEYRERKRKRQSELYFKNKYNLSIDDYEKIVMSQNFACLICGRHQDELEQKLFVDHDHETGRVRGLLCSSCNSLLGYSKDNISILESAIEYLVKNLPEESEGEII